MRRKLKIAAAVVAATVAIVIASIAVIYWMIDADDVVRFAQKRIKADTERELRVEGPAMLKKGWRPRLRVEAVSYSNAPWSEHPAMFTADAIEVQVRLLSLIFRPLKVDEAILVAPRLRLERNKDGLANWDFGKGGGSAELARFAKVLASKGELRFDDRHDARKFALDLERLTAQPQGETRFVIVASGTLEGDEFAFTSSAARREELRRSGRAYAIDSELKVGRFRIGANGVSDRPFDQRNFTADMQVSGPDLAQLYKYTGIALPTTPPYKFVGTLVRNGDLWTYRDATGVLGKSPLRGTVAFRGRETRPRFTGEVRSTALRMVDIAGLFGLDPARFDPAIPKEKDGSPLPILSGEPIRVERLNAMNADIRLIADTAITGDSVFDELDARILLEDGVLRFGPFNFRSGGGAVHLRLALDARQAPPHLDLHAEIARMPVSRLVGDRKADEAAGPLSGVFDIAASGASLNDMAGDADGGLVLYMDGGRVSHLLVELIGLDVAETLGIVLTEDNALPIRCAVADFRANSGTLRAHTLFVDTSDTLLAASGTINLASEKADLRLKPRPKDWTPFSLKTEIAIEGPLADLSIFPDPLHIGPKGKLKKAANAVVTTIAGLLPPVEVGEGKDIDCAGALGAAKRSAKSANANPSG